MRDHGDMSSRWFYSTATFVTTAMALGFGIAAGPASAAAPPIIQGEAVPPGQFEQVVLLRFPTWLCLGTLIGPQVILTAAHCAHDGPAPAAITLRGVEYRAQMEISPFYVHDEQYDTAHPELCDEHDLAVGILAAPVPGLDPVPVGASIEPGQAVKLLGYGCTSFSDDSFEHGLRQGDNQVEQVGNHRMKLHGAVHGAAACYGDSGGPSLRMDGAGPRLAGVHSRANIEDTTWDIRMDHPDTVEFLRQVARRHQVAICGITADCR